jgi:hypothetical protein
MFFRLGRVTAAIAAIREGRRLTTKASHAEACESSKEIPMRWLKDLI